MVKALLDTNILIDFLRGIPAASEDVIIACSLAMPARNERKSMAMAITAQSSRLLLR